MRLPARAALAPPAPAPARPQVPLLWRVREALVAYLPLMMMALLALGTWWLVQNTPLPADDKPVAPVRHEADYTMRQFVVQRFTPEGRLRAQIEGDELRHYPDTDTIEIDGVHVRAVGPDGRITVATARRALANGDATEVQLMGGAQVVREALRVDGKPLDEPIEFRGEFLHAFLNTERVRSHLPVTVLRGGAELRADSLDYDNLGRVAQMKGRVRATFLPPGGKNGGSPAGAFTRPLAP